MHVHSTTHSTHTCGAVGARGATGFIFKNRSVLRWSISEVRQHKSMRQKTGQKNRIWSISKGSGYGTKSSGIKQNTRTQTGSYTRNNHEENFRLVRMQTI